MKKIIYLMIFLLLISTASANIDLSLTEYDSVKQKAKIRLHNTGAVDYRDLTLSIEGNRREFPGSLLKPDTAILIPVNVAPGTRDVVVETREGFVFRQTLNFAKDFEQKQQERERQDLLDQQVEEVRQQITQSQENAQDKQEIEFNYLWLILPLAVIIIFLIFFFMKRRKPKNPSMQTNTPKTPPKSQPPKQQRQKTRHYPNPVSRIVSSKPRTKHKKPRHHRIKEHFDVQAQEAKTNEDLDVFSHLRTIATDKPQQPKQTNNEETQQDIFERMPTKNIDQIQTNDQEVFNKLAAIKRG